MTKRIRLMHLMLSLEVGGMENGVVNTLRLINKDLFKPFVCCLERVGSLAQRIEGSDVTIINMAKKPGFSPLLILRLAALLKRSKIDILHTHCWATLLYGFAAGKIAMTPTIIHGEHGTFNLDYTRRHKTYNIFIDKVDRILTVSDSLKTALITITSISDSRISTIINGVDTDKFYPRNSVSIKKGLGFHENDMVIGSVGRLENVKNYKMLIKCVAMFKDPSIKGLLIGDGSLRSELQDLVRDLGLEDRFFFLGERKNVHELLGILDVFVLSSFSEGLSNTILEAMASGIPVVATNVGGNPELVRDGETGYLVESNDHESMKAALGKTFTNNGFAKTMGKRAREIAVRDYSLKRMVGEYEDVYLSQYLKKAKPTWKS